MLKHLTCCAVQPKLMHTTKKWLKCCRKDLTENASVIHRTYARALFDWAPVTRETREDPRAALDQMSTNIRGLKSFQDSGTFPQLQLPLSVSKFPRSTQTEWEKEIQSIKGVPPRIQALPDSGNLTHKSEAKDERPKKQKAAVHTLQVSSFEQTRAKFKCTLCSGDRHSLYFCSTFKAMPIESKNSHVKNSRLCYNCLGNGHRTKDCRSTARCKNCGKSHHTLLHIDYTPAAPENPSTEASPSPDNAVVNVITSQKLNEPTACLLMTSQVVVQAPSGQKLVARALLDVGATT